MALGRTVPWVDWDEWTHVGRCLFATDTALIQRGIDRVAAWRARGRVPIGVDSTALLVETQLSDQRRRQSGGAPTFSETSLRLQYSLAIIRLVNGIADSSQRGSVAASVASLANAAGMPWLLVDLRHEATHNELPTLAALRRGAKEGLKWLEVCYWDRQRHHIDASLCKIRGTLESYLSLHIAAAVKGSQSLEGVSVDDTGDRGDQQDEKLGMLQVYDPVSAKKQRENLLTELKVLVPRPCAKWLMDGALKSVEAAIERYGCKEGKEGGRQRDAVLLGIKHACDHILPVWPSLRGLLLMKLASTKLDSAGALDVSAWDVWIDALVLPPPHSSSTPKGIKESGKRASSVPHMSQNTIKAILAQAVASYSAALDQQVLAGLTESLLPPDQCNDQAPKPAQELLRSLILRLTNMLGPENSQLAQYCRQTIEKAASGQIYPQLETSTLNTPLNNRKEGKRKKGIKNGSTPIDQSPPRKWKRLERSEWHACAIGMLPDSVDPNGRFPKTGVQRVPLDGEV